MDQAFLNALEIWDEVKAGGKVAARTELGEPDGPK
jgi:hypothetical protein